MADSFVKSPIASGTFEGYRSNTDMTDPSYLYPPSVNCLISKDGKAQQRFGYQAEFSIGVSNSPATSFYFKTYDIAFFALGTKVYYRDFAGGVTYDTGLTLTAGTTTRFAEFFGDIYLTNTTDGPRHIICGRINGAATVGATNLVLDADFASRINAFGLTSGNVRINGTNEAFVNSATVTGAASHGGLIQITTGAAQGIQTGDNVTIASVGGTTEANGVWTVTRIDSTHFDLQASTFTNAYTSGGTWTLNPLTGNMSTTALTASYPDNAIAVVVHDISGVVGIEKPSKIEFWKSRLHLMGFPNPKNLNQPNNSVVAGQFVDGAQVQLKNIIDFTYGTGGSTKIMVGGGGRVTNILGVEDTLYMFTEGKTFGAASSSITNSGAAIGQTLPVEKDHNHGCANEDCAIDNGDGEMSYITNDRRIMRQSIATQSGAAVSFADEHYDMEIIEHLNNMDLDQTGALAYHWIGGAMSIYQVREGGQWFWHIFDHKLLRRIRRSYVWGAWQPPQSIAPVKSFFERNGVLYGTDASTDTVYSFFTTFSDNLTAITSIIATGDFNVGQAMMGQAQLQGYINQPSKLNIQCWVTTDGAGRRAGSVKVVDGSKYTYGADNSVAAVKVGDGGVADSTPTAKWNKSFGIFPSEAIRAQLIITNEQDGGYFSINSFSMSARQFPNSFSPSL